MVSLLSLIKELEADRAEAWSESSEWTNGYQDGISYAINCIKKEIKIMEEKVVGWKHLKRFDKK